MLIKINLEWMFDIVASHRVSVQSISKIYESLETKHHIIIIIHIRNANQREKKGIV